MKKITFVNNHNYQEHAKLQRWLYRSCIAIISILIILTALYIKDAFELRALLQEQKKLAAIPQEFETCMTHKRELKENQEQLQRNMHKLNRIKNSTSKTADLLQNLKQIIGQQATIVSLDLKKKELKLTLLAQNTQNILELVKQLKEHKQFTNVSLESIEPTDKGTKAYLELLLS